MQTPKLLFERRRELFFDPTFFSIPNGRAIRFPLRAVNARVKEIWLLASLETIEVRLGKLKEIEKMKNINSNNRSRAVCALKKNLTVVKARQVALAGIITAVFSVSVSAVLTPPSGILSAPVFVRASFADPTDVKFKVKGQSQEVINVNNAQETVVQQIVIAPGGSTGSHSHPGPVVVLIKSGQMSFYDGEDPTCTVRTYSAGEAFIDSGQGHVHIARNESQSQNLELWATYFDVPAGGAFRIDAPNPGNCNF
jgi:quercetin dioxygenase-like cupin family protein